VEVYDVPGVEGGALDRGEASGKGGVTHT
jgi:hypothetical protein